MLNEAGDSDEKISNNKVESKGKEENKTTKTTQEDSNNDKKDTEQNDDESVVASNQTGKEKSQVEEPSATENDRTGMELEESPIYGRASEYSTDTRQLQTDGSYRNTNSMLTELDPGYTGN